MTGGRPGATIRLVMSNAPGTVLLVTGMMMTAADVPVTANETDLRELLRRAGEYVLQYHESLTAVVAEELYVQKVTKAVKVSSADRWTLQAVGDDDEERTLRSELALVRGARGEDLWLAIRDVLEVNGKRVVEGRSRLDALLRDSRDGLQARARAIAIEQAKYNLGNIYRTINVPTLPLEFLLPDRQPRFRFKRTGTATLSGISAVALAYDERSRPTFIRTPSGRDVASRGTFWIDPANGRVLKTELSTAETRGLRSRITVTYGFEPRLDLLMPMSMHEEYADANTQITATATYSNFRRFETESRIVR